MDGCILTPDGWIDGKLHFDTGTGRIGRIEGTPASPATPFAAAGRPRIVPGFIDLHVHGGGGADCMEGSAALRAMARLHAQHGTTSLLATTMTAPRAVLDVTLAELGRVCREAPGDGARVLGIHLEGPYINPARLGAQPDAAAVPVRDEVLHYLSLAPVRVVTLAPEIQGDLALIALLAERGIRVQLGHTVASYEQAVGALEHGAAGFTHLYNAMSPLLHRAPGAVGAALAHARFSEVIPDLLHVHPGAIRAALRAIPRLYCVTDGTAACGMPDGDYKLGSQTVNKCLGAVRLADGTLAGSTLTMDQALRNLVAIGLSLADASARVSRYPAEYLGLGERGNLVAGAFADIVILDADLAVAATYVEGRRVPA
ncbi:N-acetylglucosamine-6-phosphate deacetylase [Robbsia sp. Bb-Pol-6]|uniref:N-acetylglucosamine-6-phosphate deacetylase n=1 Tax=Robbsia betulipollinis TaxID=2981849 RepID=A0ABT3ZIS8_9BURK|nr:N-acetylglucosamine-6-phosphate deacetylase [Robbsia betulipollinis]MCY0386439.1 N-acetylglucosamine-6-phosphate deacetylase [Robbsia betulipollinis]